MKYQTLEIIFVLESINYKNHSCVDKQNFFKQKHFPVKRESSNYQELFYINIDKIMKIFLLS